MSTALLVQLSIQTWTARKLDKKATQSTVEAYGAVNESGRFHKALLGKTALKSVNTAAHRLRDFHYENTLAASGGMAVLPSSNYFDYINGVASLTEEFDKAVAEFKTKYKSLVSEASTELSGLYNESDYPTDIDSKFGVKTAFLPIPDNEEWKQKLDIQDDGASEMLETAVEDLRSRFLTQVTKAYARASDKDHVFKQGTLDHLFDLVDSAPKLNFTDDEAISEASEALTDLLSKTDAEDIRNDPLVRALTAEVLKDIMETLEC